MSYFFKLGGIGWALMCLSFPAFGHHPGHGASANPGGSLGAYYQPYSAGDIHPEFRVGANFLWNHLDGDAGNVFLAEVSGELRIFPRTNLFLRIPGQFTQFETGDNKAGVGDLGAGLKVLIWDSFNLSLLASGEITFPIGDRDKGTGVDKISLKPAANLIYDAGVVIFNFGAGLSFLASGDPEPDLNLTAGIGIPIIRKVLPTSVFAELQATTLLADPVFENGSTKLLGVVGVSIQPLMVSNLTVTLAGKISLWDELSVKDDAGLEPDNLSLTQDVFAGAYLSINFNF